MGWVLYRFRRAGGWRRGLALSLIVAIVGAGVMATAAGARRTATAADRLAEEAGEFDVFVDASAASSQRWSAIPTLTPVDRSTAAAFVYAFPEDGSYHPLLVRTDPPGGAGDQVGAGYVVDGRQPHDGADDEVALSEHSAEELGLELGDVLRLVSFTPDGAAASEASEDVAPDGPALELEVVGIVRSRQDLTARPGDPTVTLVPYGFFERYRGEVGMAEGIFLIDLDDQPGARQTFTRELREAFADDEVPFVDALGSNDALEQSLSVLQTGLFVFALAAYLAGTAAIAQATSRAAATRESEQLALAGLGLGRSGRWLDAWAPIVLAGVAGVAAAVVLTVLVSPRFPVGLARRVDPDLGWSVDPAVVAAGAGVLLLTVSGLGAWSAWRSTRVPRDTDLRASWRTGPRLTRGLSRVNRPTVAVGVGMAARPGRGDTGVPVRTAVSGVVVATAGLVAALVFGASMVRLIDTPERYGWPWDVVLATPGDDPQSIIDRSDTEAVGSGVFNATAEVEGTPVFAFSLDPVKGEVAPTITEGRVPHGGREVALGAETRSRLSAPSTVAVVDQSGRPQDFDVVGTVVIPTIEDPVPIDEGAYFAPEGLARLGHDDTSSDDGGFRQTVVRFADGIDVVAEVEALRLDDEPNFPTPPQEIERLEQVTGLPGMLAAFLAVLGVIAVWQALWQTVRRRRREVAVLRTIGLDRRQVVATFGWQAAAISLVGTALGLPLGLVLGRAIWAAVTADLGVAGDVTVPATVAFVVAAVLVVPMLLGLGFGARAARRPCGADLRVE